MRPEVLYPLFAPITNLKGIGPRLAKLFAGLAGEKVVDLCWHLPSGIVDRRYSPPLSAAQPGRVATLALTVGSHAAPANRRSPYRVACHDDSGSIELVFFHARADYLGRILPEGGQVAISGKLEIFNGQLQMTHPDQVVPLAEIESLKIVEPQYPLTAGVTQNTLRKAVQEALQDLIDLPEWNDPALMSREGWPSWRSALLGAHAPADMADLAPLTAPRRRLAYDELLANQLAIALVRRHQTRQRGRAIKGDGRLRREVLAGLPFTLTGAQKQALREIDSDMASDNRMLRMLQGDVGSGKTLVAFFAMLAAVECGQQAAMMAPTELLVRQHYETLKPLAESVGLEIVLLSGRDKGKLRETKRGRLASGESAIALGTHALFQKDIAFDDLAMVVIDEQHRFGVHQRLELAGKGQAPDVLVMTATPIPRTLMLTAYGDMETSRLTEKPPGRQEIDTRTLPLDRLEEVVEAVGRALDAGRKVYWVCPLVSESEISDLAAAEVRFQALEARFGAKVGLLHGKMKAPDKDAAMASFIDGPIDLLVATTVIEVGVDVPAATVMVIERAERFGLAQLHQLRGRIGRGKERSTCLLVYQGPLGEPARARLKIMRESNDGFRISEEDLKLRGAGELLGTRQSGFPEFRLADLAVHGDLLAIARDDAKLILERSPELEGQRGDALRVLLYLFERDAAVRFIRSG